MSKSIGISLSGGAIRGVAHIGVLQALEEQKIEIEAVSGASAGSLVGCLYAAGYSPKEILNVFEDASIFNLFSVVRPKFGITDLSYIDKRVKELIPENTFESLQKSFHASVTNLSTGQFEIMGSGPLSQVVVASSSIPILFAAQRIGEDLYVDGGVLNNLPVEPVRKSCDLLIGVNVSPIRQTENLDNLMEIGFRCLDLVTWNNVESRLNQCDIILEPGAQNFAFFELKKAREIYQIGYETTVEKMPEILEKLGRDVVLVDPVPLGQDEAEKEKKKKISPIRRFWKKIVDFFRNLFN